MERIFIVLIFFIHGKLAAFLHAEVEKNSMSEHNCNEMTYFKVLVIVSQLTYRNTGRMEITRGQRILTQQRQDEILI